MRHTKAVIWLFSVLAQFVWLSCDPSLEQDKGAVVAKAADAYLYQADLKGIVPHGTSSRDSMAMIDRYINNWVRKKILVHHAESNLTPDQTDFSRQLEEYEHSLVIFAYESALVEQQLDTVVSMAEIEKYYTEHPNEFVLIDNLVKVVYVVADKFEQEQINQFKTLILDVDSLMIDSIETICMTYDASCYLNDEAWMYVDELLEQIPIENYNQELFLKNNKSVLIEGDRYTFLVYFIDYMLKESISPLEFVMQDIRQIILNQRKMLLLKTMREQVFQDAIKNGTFEIYLPTR